MTDEVQLSLAEQEAANYERLHRKIEDSELEPAQELDSGDDDGQELE